MPEGLTRLLVEPQHEGLRLDLFLAEVSELSRRRGRELITAGLVWRNGSAIRVQSRALQLGDVIDVLRPAAELGCPAQPQVAVVTLLHEDSWLVIADKPAGVLSQSATDSDEPALDQQLRLFLSVRDGRRHDLKLVHRLDRLTSGAMLFARHSQALPPLTRAWQQGRVVRLYLALVCGLPDFAETELQGAIARDREHTWRFKVSPDGKPARTRVQVLSRDPQASAALVACCLVTGRTHQVRVHLADTGHPVLGDRLYGAAATTGERQLLLHAAALALPHPRTGKTLQVVSPPPVEIQAHMPGSVESVLREALRMRADDRGAST